MKTNLEQSKQTSSAEDQNLQNSLQESELNQEHQAINWMSKSIKTLLIAALAVTWVTLWAPNEAEAKCIWISHHWKCYGKRVPDIVMLPTSQLLIQKIQVMKEELKRKHQTEIIIKQMWILEKKLKELEWK